jgi:hypothetical protein
MITKARARALRRLIEKAAISLSDADAFNGAELFPRWSETAIYSTGDRVCYESTLYKCLQDHTAQSAWNPADAVSLWVRVDDPSIEWPEWVQPVGAADAYPKGAKVSYNEKHWISDVDNNVWAPGTYGWSEA